MWVYLQGGDIATAQLTATESPDGFRHQSLNATSSHYRTWAVLLETGYQLLVGGDANVVRVRWGGKPQRKSNGVGKEFIVMVGPEQSNPLAGGIRLFGTVSMAKQPDPGSAIPTVSRYMYLQREQAWRSYSTQAHGRDQCDRPGPGIAKASPYIPRSPPENGTSAASAPVRKWADWLFSWATYLSVSVWKGAVYGMPAVVGISTGMVWSHRDVLFAAAFFSSVFLIWTRYAGSPDSYASFATQAIENAKALRCMISVSLIELARWWWGIKMVMVLGALIAISRETYRWVIGGETRITLESPGPTDASAPDEPVLPTGTGVEEASHHSTITPEEGCGISKIPQTPTAADAQVFDLDAQTCEASVELPKGCSRQQIAGRPCDEELDKSDY